MVGKRAAVEIVATFVERDQHRFRRDCRGNRCGLLGNAGIRVPRAALGQFLNFEAAKTELAADVVEPLAIAFGKLSFRPLLKPPDGNDEEAHDQAQLPRVWVSAANFGIETLASHSGSA